MIPTHSRSLSRSSICACPLGPRLDARFTAWFSARFSPWLTTRDTAPYSSRLPDQTAIHLRNTLLVLALLLNLALTGTANAAWQCKQDGKTVYQDTPCENGKPVRAAPAADAANLKEAKARAAREKAQLAKIDAAKAREEALAAKKAALAAKQAQRRQMMEDRRAAQCQRARQQQKWAEQDVTNADIRQLDKARHKATRAQEKTQLLCTAR